MRPRSVNPFGSGRSTLLSNSREGHDGIGHASLSRLDADDPSKKFDLTARRDRASNISILPKATYPLIVKKNSIMWY